MKTHIILCVLVTYSALISAQNPTEKQQEAMEKLSWLEGTWKGAAWTQMGPQKRDTFWMTETISYKLDRTIVEVEGIGKDKTGEVAHHARAVISYNANTQKYQWHAWRIPGGIFSEHEPQLSEKGFTWAMEVPSGNIRYEVTHTEEDGWFETGEFSSDGESWTKFFEMNLHRSNNQETSR